MSRALALLALTIACVGALVFVVTGPSRHDAMADATRDEAAASGDRSAPLAVTLDLPTGDGRERLQATASEAESTPVPRLRPKRTPLRRAELVIDVDQTRAPDCGALEVYEVWPGGGRPVCEHIERSGDRLRVHLDDRARRGLRTGIHLELRNAARTASSGTFTLADREHVTLALSIVPVGVHMFLFERDDDETFVELEAADTIKFTAFTSRRSGTYDDGTPLPLTLETFGWIDVIREGYVLERCTKGPLEISFRFAGFEPVTETLMPILGEVTTTRIALRRTGGAAHFSGRVVADSGEEPRARQLPGRVRIVDATDSTQQFNVDLDWVGGVAIWRSRPVPPGEYRVWIDDTGPVTVTPAGERILSPPLTGVDWRWEDRGPVRTLAVRVTAAESGEPLEDDLEVTTRWSATRVSRDTLVGALLRRRVPAGSRLAFTIEAPGRERVDLHPSDFNQPGLVDRYGHDVGPGLEAESGRVVPVVFADVVLRRLAGRSELDPEGDR